MMTYNLSQYQSKSLSGSREPLISVIIPAYNAEATVEAAIRSVQAQTWQPFEIIVVEDGSNDGTAALVSGLQPSVTLVRQPNGGCGEARNTGVRSASGTWLAFLDADDQWLPGKLAAQVPETTDPEVAVVSCRATRDQGKPSGPRIVFDDLWLQNKVVVSSSLVRRSAFEQAGGFWSRRACEDYHLWLRLTAAGWKIAICPDKLVVYTPVEASLSRQTASFAAAEIACIQDIAARCGIPSGRLRKRLLACHLKHSRGAVHTRDMNCARALAFTSLRYGLSVEQLRQLAISCLPASVLDFRRRALSAASAP